MAAPLAAPYPVAGPHTDRGLVIAYRIAGIPASLAAAARRTLRSPQYSHPAHKEVATGTGPCRVCLRTFCVGSDERLLFTYQPFTDPRALPSPGPVFIHTEACVRYDACAFPDTLRELPLAFDAYGAEGQVQGQIRVTDGCVEDALNELLAGPRVEYVHIRHGEAGCFIARVDPCLVCG